MSRYTGPTLHVIFYFRITDATRAALTDLESARPAVKLLYEFASRALDDPETFSRFKVINTNTLWVTSTALSPTNTLWVTNTALLPTNTLWVTNTALSPTNTLWVTHTALSPTSIDFFKFY